MSKIHLIYLMFVSLFSKKVMLTNQYTKLTKIHACRGLPQKRIILSTPRVQVLLIGTLGLQVTPVI